MPRPPGPFLRPAATLALVLVVLLAPSAAYAAEPAAAPPLRVEAPDHLRGMAATIRQHWDSTHRMVAARIGSGYSRTVTVYLAANDADVGRIFAELRGQADSSQRVPPGFAGWALPAKGVIVLNAASFRASHRLNQALVTLRHELCHLILGQFQHAAGQRWPLWFEEGVCQWVQRSIYEPSSQILAVRMGTVAMPSLEQVDEYIRDRESRAQVSMGYAMAEFVVRHLMERHAPRGGKESAVIRLAEQFVNSGGDFEVAFQNTFGLTVDEFEAELRQRIEPASPIHAVATFVAANFTGLLFATCGVLAVLAVWQRRVIKRRVLAYLEARERAEVAWEGEPSADDADFDGEPLSGGPYDDSSDDTPVRHGY